ncbi:hypothetical protein Tco_0671346 [Tanacetum coccineum]
MSASRIGSLRLDDNGSGGSGSGDGKGDLDLLRDEDGKSDGGEDDNGNSYRSSGYHVDNGASLHQSMAAL